MEDNSSDKFVVDARIPAAAPKAIKDEIVSTLFKVAQKNPTISFE